MQHQPSADNADLAGQSCLSSSTVANAIELRRQLHWLPVRQRIDYKLTVITRKIIITSLRRGCLT